MSTNTGLDMGGAEKFAEVQVAPSKNDPSSAMKTTKNGVILVPQPTDDPDEPLVRSILPLPAFTCHRKSAYS
jgi:hypothetical protein